jgi:hypothetical protein
MSRNRPAWRRKWEANAPEQARFVEMKIVCDKHPGKTLWSQCLSTVEDPRYAGRVWVTGRPEQWAPHYGDVAAGAPIAESVSASCDVSLCRSKPSFRGEDLDAILRIIARDVSHDGTWDVSSRVVSELVSAMRSGDEKVVVDVFASSLVRHVRRDRREMNC